MWLLKLPDYQSFGRKTKLEIESRQDTWSTLELVYYTKYDANFNNTTVAYAYKYSLHLIIHEKVSKKKIKRDKQQYL